MVRRIICLALLSFFPIVASAAVLSGDEAISVSISPEYPGRGEAVTISITGRTFDVDSATVTWTVGGKKVLEGPAEKSYSFTTSESGAVSTITATVLTSDGTRYQKGISISPSQVDLIWEAQTYTPPFFKGHSLASSEGVITVVALAELKGSNGVKISASKLIYKWSKDGKNISSASGLGKQSFTFTGAKLFNDNKVTVSITSQDGLITAERSISIPVSNPRIVVYPAPALLGTEYGNALTNSFTLQEDEMGVRAVPFYFSTTAAGAPATTLAWSLNGKILPTEPGSDMLATLRRGTSAGTARISVKGAHTSNLLQSAEWSGIVNLGSGTNTF